MIPLVMANEQGSVQAFNPSLFGTGVVVYPLFICTVVATRSSEI